MNIQIDNRLSDSPMVQLDCRRCGAQVLVRKGSWNQTSVQWNADASAACLQRRDPDNSGAYSGRGVFLGCSALTDSITGAVDDGDLPVVDETDSIPT
ncbi:MAG: ferredoxin [Mycobacterium sp.]